MERGDDAADLRAQLKLAQERLASYQKFDRDIAENVRRSSELMLEAIQVRDRMDHDATKQVRARQERMSARLQAMQNDLETVRDQVGALLERMVTLRDEIDSERSVDGASDKTDRMDAGGSAAESADDGGAISDMIVEAEADDQSVTAGPQAVDLIAHGMTRAASALALQSHLRGLGQVEAVDAREFSSGVLRLHLTLRGELADSDLLGWEGDDDVTVVRHQPNTIELRLGE
jgi:hypothetical protein